MSAPATRRLPPRKAPAGSGLMLPLLLSIAAVVSAVAVVQIKHGNRALTTTQSQLRDQRDQLEVEWAQLQLEEAAHSSHARIEQIAREQLKMVEPRETVMVPARDTVSERGAMGAGASRVDAQDRPEGSDERSASMAAGGAP